MRKLSPYRWVALGIVLTSVAVFAQDSPVLIEAEFGSTGGVVTGEAVTIVGHLGSSFTTPVLTLDDVRVVPGLYGQPLTPSIVGDFDRDGTTGFPDFLIFAGVFGLTTGDDGFRSDVDLDRSGDIGFSDFLIFAAAFGSRA